MKTILSSLQNFFGNGKNFGPMTFLLIILFVALLGSYSNGFNNITDTMGGRLSKDESNENVNVKDNAGGVMPSQPLGENSDYASVSGMKGTTCNTPDCNKKAMENPESLLPNDANSAWAKINPTGQGSLSNVNLLNAGYHIGGQSQSMRNSNLQLRSEPANPRGNTGPWLQSTIESDTMRKTLEIGS
tara:strand:- start:416 stop:976 length:561 start_codon:yes stop_codon:yes gene_type:complete